ncbi:BgTH12-02611 [Blumeria graminis f. sp. triticale]|uniref:BgTH12-02611 n=1 Tax=Blumeria graminis f. sp. triticale TaxID=1689686 RepID=A0A9W4D6R0_BLUGR|nr:BgTH12-02611 [Blumeria graminis f. sp. triticale]
MNCIIAVLLLTARDSMITDRLIIMSSFDPDFYGIYDPPYRNRFPPPALGSDIFMSDSTITSDGTYNVYYCSPTLEKDRIINIITHGLNPISYDDINYFGQDENSINSCKASITAEFEKYPQNNIFFIDSILDMKSCTLSNIVYLAHIGWLSILDHHNFNLKVSSNPIYRVKLHKDLKIVDMLSSNEIFMVYEHHKQYILAWSLGHLRVFFIGMNVREWILDSRIGNENINVKSVCYVLGEYNLQILPTRQHSGHSSLSKHRASPLSSRLAGFFGNSKNAIQRIKAKLSPYKLPTRTLGRNQDAVTARHSAPP